jgi:quinol monooxygenase YgiN
MKKFLALIPAASTTGLDLSHYAAVGGYLDLFADSRECGIMQDTRIACTSPSARTTVVAALANLAATVEKAERAAGGEAGVYTYQVFKSLDDEVSARIFARFKGREEMEAFLRREEVVGFWMAQKEGMKSMECRGYLPNGKGWLHR